MSVYEKYVVAGVMSGTSVDGLDICVCKFENDGKNWIFEILDSKAFDYSKEMQSMLLNVSKLSAVEIIQLENDFSNFIANSINSFIADRNFEVDIIASHGHTVFHDPSKSYTYQIGNGELIAKKTGITTVFDFRRGDVALGGQGAPLVPIADRLLFGDYSACLNLGGFSNISYENKDGDRIAFDISPVNIVLNKFARMIGMQFDKEGETAKTGMLISELYKELASILYYSEQPPKSLAIEWVKSNFDPILKKYESNEISDILHTLTMHIADVISTELSKHKEVLITGGGAYNTFLIELLNEKSNTNIVVPSSHIIDYKEALAFGLLGVLRIREETNVLKSVTGAFRDSSCGVIAYP